MSELMRLARAVANRRATAEIAQTEKRNAVATVPTGVCATCAHYRAVPDDTSGRCAKHRTETWGEFADGCAGDWAPSDPAARELERRRAGVIARLKADPALRYSFDVADVPLRCPADRDVLVLLGLRDAAGQIVTGELRIPADRWPGIAVFTEHWRRAAEGLPS